MVWIFVLLCKPITAYSYLDIRMSKICECPGLSVLYYVVFFLLVYALEQFFIGMATQLHCITSVTKVYIENSA